MIDQQFVSGLMADLQFGVQTNDWAEVCERMKGLTCS
jgi:hypothetical protein